MKSCPKCSSKNVRLNLIVSVTDYGKSKSKAAKGFIPDKLLKCRDCGEKFNEDCTDDLSCLGCGSNVVEARKAHLMPSDAPSLKIFDLYCDACNAKGKPFEKDPA